MLHPLPIWCLMKCKNFDAKMMLVRDALTRSEDGREDDNWRYVLEQLNKASYYLSELIFDADLIELIKEYDEKNI